MRRSLSRRERLRRSSDIRGLFSAARRVESRGLKLLFRDNGSPTTRFAVVVTRGSGGAVKRNREKRITREAFRSLKETIHPGFDLVFLVIRPGAPFKERQSIMGQLLVRAGVRL
jgi:putative membrane protein insertion efficiency factor/ribonuclease P protein component